MFKICIYNKFCQIEYIYISYDIISMKENFFKKGKTKDVNFRIESLNKFYDAI